MNNTIQLIEDNKIVFEWDVPYSLMPMAREAGLSTFIYQPSKCRKELLANRVRLLSIGYNFIKNNKTYLETFNPVNEDVNYDYFVNFVGQYILACIAYPDAEIKVS